MSSEEKTYFIKDGFEGRLSITCFICGMTSYNQNDVEQKYCGNCNQFHSIMMAMKKTKEKE